METLRTCAAILMLGLVGSADAARKPVIVSEAEKTDYWQPAPTNDAGYPAVVDKSADVCVNIGYQVKEDGSVADFTLLKSWTSKTREIEPAPELTEPFVQAAALAISLQQRTPNGGKGKPRAIYTSATFAFVGASGAGAGQVRTHCDIPDLKGFIARLQEQANRRGSINRTDIERRQRESTRDIQGRVGGN